MCAFNLVMRTAYNTTRRCYARLVYYRREKARMMAWGLFIRGFSIAGRDTWASRFSLIRRWLLERHETPTEAPLRCLKRSGLTHLYGSPPRYFAIGICVPLVLGFIHEKIPRHQMPGEHIATITNTPRNFPASKASPVDVLFTFDYIRWLMWRLSAATCRRFWGN